ncbi:MAG: HAMP domain-containing histidine kinase, partial [Gammaproteobacteria bacterium]|nr:HAMP domain-containing histidine kinase [Gammaproteobacteria bacterium]
AIGNFILLQNKEKSLLQLNERLKTLVGYVAHDLRNPLGIVSNLSQIAVSIEQSEEDQFKLFKRIHTNAERCLEMVNSILDLAALGTGKITINAQPFLFRESLNDAIDNYTVLAGERDITINIEVPVKLTVNGDRMRLLQMFNNLLGNAIKYSVKGQEVNINYSGEEDHRAFISMTNTYNKEQTKLDSINNDLYKSVGFGLDIVREILYLHDSKLEIIQDGSLFTARFSLPIA